MVDIALVEPLRENSNCGWIILKDVQQGTLRKPRYAFDLLNLVLDIEMEVLKLRSIKKWTRKCQRSLLSCDDELRDIHQTISPVEVREENIYT